MRLVVTSLELCRLNSIRTSFGEEPLPFEEARAGCTVRMVPSSRHGSGGSYLATVLKRDFDSVVVRWHDTVRGGPSDELLGADLGTTANRDVRESREWWSGGGRARKVKERVVAPWPDADGSASPDYGGLEIDLPNLQPGCARDVLVLGQVRCVGLTELVFHVGARPWEQEDKRRLRHNVAHAIGEDPAEVRFAEMGEVGEDGCVVVRAAFPHHPHPRIAQRRLLMLADESPDETGLYIPLTSAQPAQPRRPDVRCAVHFRYSEVDSELSGSALLQQGSNLSSSTVSRADSRGTSPRPRVAFDSANDVAHTASAEMCLAERVGMASGRVREEVFRQNLCTVLGRGSPGAGQEERRRLLHDLLRILSSHMYDHPLSGLRETVLFRELLYAAVEGEVGLNDPNEWVALLRSLREQRHVPNRDPLDPHPMRRHRLFLPSGTAVGRVHDAVVRIHSEVTRLEYHETEAEQLAAALEVVSAVEGDEEDGRRLVAAEEHRSRLALLPPPARVRRPQSVSPSPVPARAARTPPRSRAVKGTVPRLPLSSPAVAAHSPQPRVPPSAHTDESSARHPLRHPSPLRPADEADGRRRVQPSAARSLSAPYAAGNASAARSLAANGHARTRPPQRTSSVGRSGSRSRSKAADAAAPKQRARSRSQPRQPPSPDADGRHPSPPQHRPHTGRMSARSDSAAGPKRRPVHALSPSAAARAARKDGGLRPGDRMQVMCGKEAVAAVCAASSTGWKEAHSRFVGRCGRVVAVDASRGTAVLRFAALGLSTHDPGRQAEWPLAALVQPSEDCSDDRSDSSEEAAARVPSPHRRPISVMPSPHRIPAQPSAMPSPHRISVPASALQSPHGRSSQAAAKRRPQRSRPVGGVAREVLSRGARLGAVYAAPAAAVACVVVCCGGHRRFVSPARVRHPTPPPVTPPPEKTDFERGCPSPASDLSSVTSIHLNQRQDVGQPEMLQ
eukprot:TRINITY_DN4272_c0_g1_i3.p1 TRINITY_DN4272_c0_g1~~TRINITY_DN4272_c0_g1_i3.p1  ORF type:complete len:961 (+),score=329.65 TRINITY_DN4272_c0_g1_i3:1200-4082(+)